MNKWHYLARPATIPRARAAVKGAKANSCYHQLRRHPYERPVFCRYSETCGWNLRTRTANRTDYHPLIFTRPVNPFLSQVGDVHRDEPPGPEVTPLQRDYRRFNRSRFRTRHCLIPLRQNPVQSKTRGLLPNTGKVNTQPCKPDNGVLINPFQVKVDVCVPQGVYHQ
jgi:hypothetical protein